jgi:hypothetical protein
MKKTILFAVSFLVGAIAVYAQQAETQAVNAENVPIEEYVPKVIIEGKWGTGPGEFGVAWTYASDVNVPQNESGEIPPIYPGSLAAALLPVLFCGQAAKLDNKIRENI